ncbi:MAG: type II toxin-antitoxin system HicA family toxin [Anaerolineae bacterium]
MTRLPQISGRECARALEKVGFYVDRQKGSHIILMRDDPKARVSVPNHRTLKPGTLRAILQHADMTVEEFVELL